MYQLEIKRPGSLESIILRKDITPAQVSIVTAITANPTITYGEVLAFLALRRVKNLDAPGVITALADYDAPAGAGDEVETYRG